MKSKLHRRARRAEWATSVGQIPSRARETASARISPHQPDRDSEALRALHWQIGNQAVQRVVQRRGNQGYGEGEGVQRRILASRIRRAPSNRHVQGVVASWRRDGATAAIGRPRGGGYGPLQRQPSPRARTPPPDPIAGLVTQIRGIVRAAGRRVRPYLARGRTKAILCELLRRYHPVIRGKAQVARHLGEKLKGDDRWYTLGLYHYGPETNWPLPARFKTPNPVPNTKGTFYNVLRTLRRAERRAELKDFVRAIFRHGDRTYALNLCQYGPEPKWPKRVVEALASKRGVQPGITGEATGYKLFKGRKFIGTKVVKGITYNDVKQQRLGDCSLLAALASIAKRHPHLLDKMITINPNGTYTVRFYDVMRGTVAHVEYLLPGFPVKERKIVYGRSSRRQKTELWVSILEKAYAAWAGPEGGYRKLNRGLLPSDVFQRVLGWGARRVLGEASYFKEVVQRNRSYYVADPKKVQRRNPGWVQTLLSRGLRDRRPIAAHTYVAPDEYKEHWAKLKDGNEKRKLREFWMRNMGNKMKSPKIHSAHSYAVLGVANSKVRLYNPHYGPDLRVDLATFCQIFEAVALGPKLPPPPRRTR